jgi:hypothetical protein
MRPTLTQVKIGGRAPAAIRTKRAEPAILVSSGIGGFILEGRAEEAAATPRACVSVGDAPCGPRLVSSHHGNKPSWQSANGPRARPDDRLRGVSRDLRRTGFAQRPEFAARQAAGSIRLSMAIFVAVLDAAQCESS